MAESENLKLQLRSSFQYGWRQMEQTTQECEQAGKLQQQIGNVNDYILHRVFNRQNRVNLVLAHQYLSQLDLQIRDAILENVGTIIAFRLGLTDAEILENEFRPELSPLDLISLPNYHIYLKLMIDGVVSRPFSGETLLPVG